MRNDAKIRQVPFVVTTVAASLVSAYMLLDPGAWLAHIMQLTPMNFDFRIYILSLAVGGFACAWLAELRVFLLVARGVGRLHDTLRPHQRKKRKEYKMLLNEMRI